VHSPSSTPQLEEFEFKHLTKCIELKHDGCKAREDMQTLVQVLDIKSISDQQLLTVFPGINFWELSGW
jgi:hypothetical protein